MPARDIDSAVDRTISTAQLTSAEQAGADGLAADEGNGHIAWTHDAAQPAPHIVEIDEMVAQSAETPPFRRFRRKAA